MMMSNQSSSSVYSEKKIAAYEALFKESSFAKPQEVYLTITVAHLFGQAYIMEQQGTKEGDPVYSRFVCPLEDITKVYINDNVKASPLFIQCDTNIKGVVHRKRIIVPCLENVSAIVQQIKEVQALHMEKYEAAQQREKDRKREALEAERVKEQIEIHAKEKIPPLPAVEKLEDIPVAPVKNIAPVKKPVEAPKAAETVKPAAEKSASAKSASVDLLNSDIEASIKALESMKPINVVKAAVKSQSPAEAAGTAPAKERPAEAPKPVAEVKPVAEAKPVAEVKPAPAENKPVETVKPAVAEVKPIVVEKVPEAPKPAVVPKPAVEIKAEPVPEKKPAPAKPVLVNPNGIPSGLEDFQTAVMKLKSRMDSGEITAEEYAAEKKKLISTLY